MSEFLAVLDEEMLTLEAALEFIDSCGDDADLSSDSLSEPPPAKTATRAVTTVSSGAAKPAADTRKRLGGAAQPAATARKPSASTQQQRRRKQEIQSLREQATELEAHLSQLKQRDSWRLGGPSTDDAGEAKASRTAAFGPRLPGPMIKKQKTSSVWMDLATIQFRERQRAELLNRKLKSVWTNQSKLNESIQQILLKRATFAGRDLVFNQPALYEAPSSAYVGVNVMSELEKSMRGLYLESESVFRPREDAIVAITCSTETKYEPSVGTFIDLNTTTPMSCSVEEASKLVWGEVNSKRKYPDKTYDIKPGADANSAEKNFLWTLRDGDRKVRLSGLQYVRKYVEPNRVVIVRSTLLLLPTSSAKFRDRTWMVISPSPEDPAHKSVVRYCYRVYMEPESAESITRADLDQLREFLSGALMNGMRMFAQIIQNAMLDFSARHAHRRHAANV